MKTTNELTLLLKIIIVLLVATLALHLFHITRDIYKEKQLREAVNQAMEVAEAKLVKAKAEAEVEASMLKETGERKKEGKKRRLHCWEKLLKLMHIRGKPID